MVLAYTVVVGLRSNCTSLRMVVVQAEVVVEVGLITVVLEIPINMSNEMDGRVLVPVEEYSRGNGEGRDANEDDGKLHDCLW